MKNTLKNTMRYTTYFKIRNLAPKMALFLINNFTKVLKKKSEQGYLKRN